MPEVQAWKKGHDIEVDAAEIRIRAERRLGELIKAQKEACLVKQGVRLNGTTGGRSSAVTHDHRSNPTLSDIGVSKDLSSRSQKLCS
jgi:hypothetical protein